MDEEQLETLARRVAEVFGDLRRFGALLTIRTKGGGLSDFAYERWHEEQRRFEADRTGWDIVLKPRQIGFSTLELARDLLYALTHPGSQVLIVSHDRKLGELLFAGLRVMYESLRAWGLAPDVRADNVRELVFEGITSSVRVVESGATDRTAAGKGRSGTVHRLHATEVAFWPAAYTTMTALLGCVPDNGEVVIESTPNGAAGMFFRTFSDAMAGRGRYRAHFYPWYEHSAYRAAKLPDNFDPRPLDRWETKLRALGCNDHQIAWWRARAQDPQIGIEKTLQEWPIDPVSAFRTAGGQWIPGDVLDWLGDQVRPPLATLHVHGADLRIYRGQRPHQLGGGWDGRGFIVGADVAEGVERDRSTAVVVDEVSGETVAAWHNDAIEPGDFAHALASIGRLFTVDGRPARLAVERNNNGGATLRALTHEVKYPPERIWRSPDDQRLGHPTNPRTRPILWEALGRGVRERVFWSPDADTVGEAKTIVRDTDGQPRAAGKGTAGGAHDDLIVGWALAILARQNPGYVPRSGHIAGL